MANAARCGACDIAILPILSTLSTVCAAMVWTTVFLCILLIRSPYIRKGDDRLHQFVEVRCFPFAC